MIAEIFSYWLCKELSFLLQGHLFSHLLHGCDGQVLLKFFILPRFCFTIITTK